MSNVTFLWIFSRGIELGVIVLCLLPVRALFRRKIPRLFSYLLWAALPANIIFYLVVKIVSSRVANVVYIHKIPKIAIEEDIVDNIDSGNSNLTEDEKENLNKQKELLEKQDAMADKILSQYEDLINTIAIGNKKDINAKQKALTKTVKQFDKISEDANNLNTQLSEHIEQTYGVRGTIVNYLGKALKKTLTAINNYENFLITKEFFIFVIKKISIFLKRLFEMLLHL